jgi:hypothetical protein
MHRAEEEAAIAGDDKRDTMAEQPVPDYLADMLVPLRTAANGFVRQCTSTNIAHQLGVTVRRMLARKRKQAALV